MNRSKENDIGEIYQNYDEEQCQYCDGKQNQYYDREKCQWYGAKQYLSLYRETCLNRTSFGQTFMFGIDRCSVYNG